MPMYTSIDATSPVGSLIGGNMLWYDLPLKEQNAIASDLARRSFALHLEACLPYRRYVDEVRATVGFDSIMEMPLITTSAFKSVELLSVGRESIEKWCLSSGTSGNPSKVARDRTTLSYLLSSTKVGAGLIGSWPEDDAVIVNLGSGGIESTIWFQYVVSLIELLYPSYAVEDNGSIEWCLVESLVSDHIGSGKHVVMIGPPYRVVDWLTYIAGTNRRMQCGSRCTIVTAGGWKKFSGSQIDRGSLTSLAMTQLCLHSEAQVRDVFTQAELNTVMFECVGLEKHVPPWVFVAARDPLTLTPCRDGELGVMSYIDASAESYPCLLLTEDLGYVRRGRCSCGRDGVRLHIERRLNSRPLAGCAVRMERHGV
jgi:long-chain-fatty-acid---luciferin-component ligase